VGTGVGFFMRVGSGNMLEWGEERELCMCFCTILIPSVGVCGAKRALSAFTVVGIFYLLEVGMH